RIVAAALTTNDVDDGSQVGPLLDQIDDPIASLTGDGAYDQDGVYGEVAARHPDAAVIVPPRSSGVPSETAENVPTPRDRHLQAIAEHGRMGWQKASGYNWRALVEADIGRWKRVIGHALRSQTDERQTAEVAIAVDVLNRMLELGRTSYVRTVDQRRKFLTAVVIGGEQVRLVPDGGSPRGAHLNRLDFVVFLRDVLVGVVRKHRGRD